MLKMLLPISTAAFAAGILLGAAVVMLVLKRKERQLRRRLSYQERLQRAIVEGESMR